MDLRLTKTDTSVLKGIAILAMLVHHIYKGTDNSWLLGQMQVVGKVCVALFVLLSGYGLCVGYQSLTPPHWEKNASVLLVRRFVKFYFNYWAIFIICVPIGIFVFGRTPELAYGSDSSFIKLFFNDILAINGYNSYNITWWFNKLIIILYLLSPILYMFAKRFPIGTFLIVLVMQNTFLSSELGAYLMSFLIGFIWSLNAEKLRCYTTKIPKVVSIFICICLIAGTILLRQHASNYLASIKCDTYLATCICLLILACKPYRLKIDTVLGFLGKHSINIYLMHTFVFYYFFKEQIYNIQSKFIIFIVVLGICLLFSVALELLKKKLKYGRLVEKVANLIERRGI